MTKLWNLFFLSVQLNDENIRENGFIYLSSSFCLMSNFFSFYKLICSDAMSCIRVVCIKIPHKKMDKTECGGGCGSCIYHTGQAWHHFIPLYINWSMSFPRQIHMRAHTHTHTHTHITSQQSLYYQVQTSCVWCKRSSDKRKATFTAITVIFLNAVYGAVRYFKSMIIPSLVFSLRLTVSFCGWLH